MLYPYICNMKKLVIITVLLISFSGISDAQEVSRNNYEGFWNVNTSWVDNTAPDFTINENVDYIINGYITIGDVATDQNLTFTNTGQNEDFTITDTLVVYGNVSHANKGHNIVIGSSGLFIVFGNFTADNKISIQSGGKFIVTGDLTFSNSPQDTYGGSGDLYVFGSTSGNADADAVDQNQSQFNANEDENLKNFVNNRGTTGTLPIVLKSFNGEVKFEEVALNWVTAKEENFSHFEVERSTDQKTFEAIGFVQGLGESLSDVSYDFTDNNPPYGNINYRLKSVDIDGSFEYSPVIQVIISFEGKVKLSPNPANSISNIRINLPSSFNDKVDLVSIYDLNGTLISQLMNVDASSDLQFDEPVKAGMYIIKVQHNGVEENLRLLVQ